MSVVIRCPNCGFTQESLGECESCHHEAVQYHCTNHSPGRWLAGPVCDACGARYGERAGRPAPPPPPAPAPRPRRPPVTLDRPSTPTPPAPPRRPTVEVLDDAPEVEEVIVWTPFGGRRVVRPRGGAGAPPYRGGGPASGWPFPPAGGGGPFGPTAAPGPSPARAVAGCVGRTVLLFVLLFLMLAFFLGSMFFG